MRKLSVLLLSLLLLAARSYGQDGFGGIFDSSDTAEEPQNSVTLNGEVGFDYTSYLDNNWESEKIILPYTDLNLLLTSASVEAQLNLTLNAGDSGSAPAIDDLVETLSLRAFFPFGYLDLGLIKTEWGTGDGIHVIDPLNPLDHSKGISDNLNRMKRPEIMAIMNFYLGDSGLLELVYKPYFHPLKTAESPTDRWNIRDLSTLPNMQTPPDTETPAYSQAAARLTAASGIFDLGAVYYYGYMSEPGYKLTTTFTGTNPLNPSHYTTTTNLVFTKAQLFGIETGWALGPFTFRTEAGFWLSEDSKGTAAHLYNNRAVWLAGFDIMIPGTSIFLSVQEFGSYVVNFDSSNPLDVDFGMSYKDNAMTNTIIAAVESSFYQDMMKFQLAGLYLFEANGYMILPAYFWKIEDDLELSLTAQVFGGEDEGPDPYYAWRNNDNVAIKLKYSF